MERMRSNHFVKVYISKRQKEIIENLADSGGYSSLSSFAKSKILDADLGLHEKINKILKKLEQSQETKENGKT